MDMADRVVGAICGTAATVPRVLRDRLVAGSDPDALRTLQNRRKRSS
jgi:hypothetical protein